MVDRYASGKAQIILAHGPNIGRKYRPQKRKNRLKMRDGVAVGPKSPGTPEASESPEFSERSDKLNIDMPGPTSAQEISDNH